jgi:hypothetical protein
MINTAWISLIHIHGQKLSGNNYGLYGKAHAPNNPRVVLVKAEFEIEQRSFGEPIQNHVCQIEKLSDFCYFKAMFSPSWGLDRALAAQAKCK